MYVKPVQAQFVTCEDQLRKTKKLSKIKITLNIIIIKELYFRDWIFSDSERNMGNYYSLKSAWSYFENIYTDV